MSVHTTAQLVYVHFCDRFGIQLFDLHVRGVLLGCPIPAKYTVHTVDLDLSKNSINLALTNGGTPVDTAALTEHINGLKIFGSIKVGIYGIRKVSVPVAA